MASKTDTSTEGRSDPAAARLRKVAAKVRQVSTSPPNDVIVFGRLIKEAHDAGAWPEGSVIGDRLRRALTSPGSDNLQRYADETVRASVLQAYEAVFGELLSGLALPSTSKEIGEWEAEILAAEIEREADRDYCPGATADPKAPWCHPHDEQPPGHFGFGPLAGTASALDAAIYNRTEPDPHYRQLKKKGREGRLWIVKRTSTCLEVWFLDAGSYTTAKKRLDEAAKVAEAVAKKPRAKTPHKRK